MATDPTRSDFARLDDRVRQVEPFARQITRVEEKLDSLHKALATLVLFEERQAAHAEKFRDLVETVHANRTQAETRAAAMAQRFDDRTTAVEKAHQAMKTELHGYVQRSVGISAAVSGLFILLGFASKFIPTHL